MQLYVSLFKNTIALRTNVHELFKTHSFQDQAPFSFKLKDFKNYGVNQFFNIPRGIFAETPRGSAWREEVWGLWLQSAAKIKTIGQPFHSVSPSPLPAAVSLAFFFCLSTLIYSVRTENSHFGFHWVWPVVLLSLIVAWVNEVLTEESQGHHTLEVQQGFRIGIVLFILSEAMLFLSFFWAYFHVTLNTSAFTGCQFPPAGVVVFDWKTIPLANTVILLSSGTSLTIAHGLIADNDRFYRTWFWVRWLNLAPFAGNTKKRRLAAALDQRLENDRVWARPTVSKPVPSFFGNFVRTDLRSEFVYTNMLGFANLFNMGRKESLVYAPTYSDFRTGYEWARGLPAAASRGAGHDRAAVWILDTALRGLIFLGLQSLEYIQALFTIKTSVYGGVFFSLTGLHGFHVFVGAVMLAISAFVMWPTQTDAGVHQQTISRPFVWGHRVAFDGVAWYWHFVDVVWLFVFIFVYWWGGDLS